MLPMGPAASDAASSDEQDLETYLLLLLSDSNLPTGGFVASSGLESFHAHGLLHNSRPHIDASKYASTSRAAVPSTQRTAPSQAQLSSATLSFARSTLHSYSRSSFPFLTRVHAVVLAYLDNGVRARADRARARQSESEAEQKAADQVFEDEERARLQACLRSISRLDHSYHTLLLNHVARRASKAQGIAFLTLYSKAFAKPIDLDREPFDGARLGQRSPPSTTSTSSTSSTSIHEDAKATRIALAASLVDKLKLDIRKFSSLSPSANRTWTELGGQHGHLPICWAVFCACLGISLRKSVFLHLFLQARSLFSSSIRLNTLGPYLAHQIMRFQLRGVVEGLLEEMEAAGLLDLPEAKSGAGEEVKIKVDVEHGASEPAKGYEISESTQAKKGAAKPFRTTPSMSTTNVYHDPLQTRPKVQSLRIGKAKLIPVDDQDENQGWAWDWPEEQDDFNAFTENGNKVQGKDSERGFWTAKNAPATTFPLGEIVQARHDQLHSRLFNS